MENKTQLSEETLKHEAENFEILINFSEEAKQKELFRFKAKTEDGYFDIPADLILEMIARNFKMKDVATAYMDAEQKMIPAVQAHLPIYFFADKDYKLGDVIQFTAPMVLPAFFAYTMEAYKLIKTDPEAPIEIIPREKFEEAAKNFNETNAAFIEQFWKKELELMEDFNKKNSADTAKADDNKAA